MMLIDIDKTRNIKTIQKMLNVDEATATQIYKEAGVSIEKIYIASKNQKPIIHSDKTYTTCLRCGRPLKTEESRRCGYGSICKDKVSRKHSKKLNFIGGVNYGIKPITKGTGDSKH